MAYSYDRRPVTASDEHEFWNRADAITTAEAQRYMSDVDDLLRKYGKACEKAQPIFEKLGPALDSPEVTAMAKLLTERADDVAELIKAHAKIGKNFDEIDDEVEAMCKRIGEDDSIKSIDGDELIRELQKLRSYKELKKIADSVVEIEAKIEGQESENAIDWTLDDYLGGAAGVYSTLQDLAPNNPFEDEANSMALTIYGLLKSYDEDYLSERVNENTPEEEEEESE